MGFLDRFRRKKTKLLYGGGSGESQEDAVVISAPDEMLGVTAEYVYVSRHCGRMNVDWTLQMQMVTRETEAGRRYDKFVVRLKNGQIREYWFDITQFYGKIQPGLELTPTLGDEEKR